MTDIPLVPAMSRAGPDSVGGGGSNGQNFVLHWMNNKEMEFTSQAVKVMEDMFRLAASKKARWITFDFGGPLEWLVWSLFSRCQPGDCLVESAHRAYGLPRPWLS